MFLFRVLLLNALLLWAAPRFVHRQYRARVRFQHRSDQASRTDAPQMANDVRLRLDHELCGRVEWPSSCKATVARRPGASRAAEYVALHPEDGSTSGFLTLPEASPVCMSRTALGSLGSAYGFFKSIFKNDPLQGLLVCFVGFGALMVVVALLRRLLGDTGRRQSSRRAGPSLPAAPPRCQPGQHDLIPAGEAHEEATSSGVKRECNFKCRRCRYRTWIPQELLTEEQTVALRAIGLFRE